MIPFSLAKENFHRATQTPCLIIIPHSTQLGCFQSKPHIQHTHFRIETQFKHHFRYLILDAAHYYYYHLSWMETPIECKEKQVEASGRHVPQINLLFSKLGKEHFPGAAQAQAQVAAQAFLVLTAITAFLMPLFWVLHTQLGPALVLKPWGLLHATCDPVAMLVFPIVLLRTLSTLPTLQKSDCLFSCSLLLKLQRYNGVKHVHLSVICVASTWGHHLGDPNTHI